MTYAVRVWQPESEKFEVAMLRRRALSASKRGQRRQLNDMTSDEGTRGDGNPNDEQDALPPEVLSRAALTWVRRGYRVRYSDAYLIQVIRRGGLGRESVLLLVLALLGFAGAAAALAIALARRPWHVVTLALGPDERVLTHEQRSAHPPEP